MHVYSAPRQRHPEDRSPCCDRKQQQEAVPETAHRPVSPIPFMAGFGLLRGQRLGLRSTRKENIRHHWVNSCSMQDAVPFINGATRAWRRFLRSEVGFCPVRSANLAERRINAYAEAGILAERSRLLQVDERERCAPPVQRGTVTASAGVRSF